jgi:hypothetical protein
MPTANGMHLFVVCTDPCVLGKVALTNISSWKGNHCDPTVKIGAGIHGFVTHDSYVAYNFSEVERTITIESGVKLTRFVQKDPFPDPPLTQIVEGLLLSRFTPRKVKKYVDLTT